MALNNRAHGGRDSITQIDDIGGTLRNISTDVTNVDVPENADSAEVSGMTHERKSYIVGQIDTPITLQGNFNGGTALNAQHRVFSGINGVATASFTFEHYPAGSAAGLPKLSGEVICISYQITAGIGGAVTWQASLLPAGSAGVVWSTV